VGKIQLAAQDPQRPGNDPSQVVKLSVKEVAVNHCISCHWLALATAEQA
jgi:hypothetical protein